MVKTPPLRVGVIGAGAVAQACHIPGYAKNRHTVLVAIADPARPRHKEAKTFSPDVTCYTDFAKMLAREDLDVVSVCTPNKFHAPATIAALKAGCHVLCEKPMAMSLAECDAMDAAARKARKKLMIGFTHRFLSGPQKCKQLLSDKKLGKPFMIRVRFAHGGPYPGWAKSDWFYNPDLALGGAMLDMGIHAIDLCLWLLGPITAVSGRAATLVKKIKVDDNALLQLEFKNGALGYIEVGWTSGPGFVGMELYGTKGSLICDYLHTLRLCTGKASAGSDDVVKWKTLDKTPAKGGWDIEIDRWVDVIRGKEKLTMNARAGRAALEVALAAYASSRNGKRVTIS